MRSCFLYNKENEGIKQINLSGCCFHPSLRKNKQLFKQQGESPNFKIKKVPNVGCYLWFGFFSKDDLMQIDTTPGNMKRAQYKRWVHLVNSAQLDRY